MRVMLRARNVVFVLLVGISLGSGATPPDASVETVDLSKLSRFGLPRSLSVTLYRATGITDKRPLIIFVPPSGTRIADDWFRTQAGYFTQAGFVVAVPHFVDLYNDSDHVVVYDPFYRDLVAAATPFALQLLATVATLTQPGGPAAGDHVVLGQEFGSLIAARYAALNPPGCKGLIMVSAGFGARESSGVGVRADMRNSKDALSSLGQQVKAPSLWLYAKGNRRVRESTANELFIAFQSAGAAATLEMLPELGIDGDDLFSNPATPALWQPPVSKFLASLGLN
jgi:pimeloyl-ACP methyl ester carboxylesterase